MLSYGHYDALTGIKMTFKLRFFASLVAICGATCASADCDALNADASWLAKELSTTNDGLITLQDRLTVAQAIVAEDPSQIVIQYEAEASLEGLLAHKQQLVSEIAAVGASLKETCDE